MKKHTCHIEVFTDKITFPDPDGEGEVTAKKGEIRIAFRTDAEALIKADPECGRILTEAESAEFDKKTE